MNHFKGLRFAVVLAALVLIQNSVAYNARSYQAQAPISFGHYQQSSDPLPSVHSDYSRKGHSQYVNNPLTAGYRTGYSERYPCQSNQRVPVSYYPQQPSQPIVAPVEVVRQPQIVYQNPRTLSKSSILNPFHKY